MRVLTASGASLGADATDVLGVLNPTIAAVVSLSPDDACFVASKLSLRYAIQCWDNPDGGKAIFWKTSVPMQGLYRAEFRDRDSRTDRMRGLLRVTLLWDGRPLHVFCVSVSESPEEAAWQLVQTAREVDSVRGAIILAIDAAAAKLPEWPHLVDAWSRAPWRSLAYPSTFDLGLETHAAFGLPRSHPEAPAHKESANESPIRLLCSDALSVVRARLHVSGRGAPSGDVLVVDLSSAANGDEPSQSQTASPGTSESGRHTGSRTGTYSA